MILNLMTKKWTKFTLIMIKSKWN